MAENKTQLSNDDVDTFLESIDEPQRRADCVALCKLMQSVTGEPARLWGKMIGFGQRHYKYASGREGDTFLLGFASRKSALTLYLACRLDDFVPELAKLGKHKTGGGCLYLKTMADVDAAVLKKILKKALQNR